MDDVPREILQAAYRRNPIYLLKVPLHLALWAGCGVLIWTTMGTAWAIPVGVACSLLITNLIRGMGAVAHDCVHGTVFRSRPASYLMGLLCWMPTGMSFTIYSNYHLHHHRITNTYPDVDNFVVTDYTKSPTLAKALLLAVYSFGYPIYFLFQMLRYTRRLSLWKKVRMNVELLVFWGMVAAAVYYLPWQFMVFLYGIPFLLGAVLASITSLIEHFEMEPGEDAYSSRTYATKRHFLNFLWNNVSYHNEHHKFPGIPWYNLRSFHEAAYPYYDDRVKAECYESFLPVVFTLWGRILRVDVAKIEAKYANLDRRSEREKHMALPGISPVNA
jgi:fatty acid desaturase